jgi:hypothetical protein
LVKGLFFISCVKLIATFKQCRSDIPIYAVYTGEYFITFARFPVNLNENVKVFLFELFRSR